eukprot:6488969-Amphidinium_carterae.1
MPNKRTNKIPAPALKRIVYESDPKTHLCKRAIMCKIILILPPLVFMTVVFLHSNWCVLEGGPGSRFRMSSVGCVGSH